jgi:hypothetical protein
VAPPLLPDRRRINRPPLHLDQLTAFLPADRVRAAHEEAVRQRYLGHEFGDLNLIA